MTIYENEMMFVADKYIKVLDINHNIRTKFNKIRHLGYENQDDSFETKENARKIILYIARFGCCKVVQKPIVVSKILLVKCIQSANFLNRRRYLLLLSLLCCSMVTKLCYNSRC